MAKKRLIRPHLCPECGKLVILVSSELSRRCKACSKRTRRKRASHKIQQKKYSNGYYRRARKRAVDEHPFCALCGCTKNLTCHHAVRVRTGEWKGKHLTVLCDKCHNLWEQKVNKIRATKYE